MVELPGLLGPTYHWPAQSYLGTKTNVDTLITLSANSSPANL